MDSLAEIMARVDTIGRRISVITAALEDQLVVGGAFRDVRQTIDAAQQLTLRLNRVATEQSQNLTTTMAVACSRPSPTHLLTLRIDALGTATGSTRFMRTPRGNVAAIGCSRDSK